MKGKALAGFIGGRILQFLILLFVSGLLIFTLCHLSRIDPVAVILGGKQTSAETIAALREKFHLNDPLPVQFFNWIGGMFKGDFGLDYKYQQPVWDLIRGRLPVTLTLTFMSAILSLVIAIPLGVLGGVRPNTGWDRASSIFSLLGMATPPFFISIIAIAIVSRAAPGISFTGGFSSYGELLGRLFLPTVCLSLGMIALAQRITRSSMQNEMKSPYIAVARAKGMPEGKVIWKHAFKNALIPLITVYGIQIGSLLVGAVLVEEVFALSGLGGLLVSAVKSGNYPVTQGVTMLLVFVFLLISTLTDILYAAIDPRVRRSNKEEQS